LNFKINGVIISILILYQVNPVYIEKVGIGQVLTKGKSHGIIIGEDFYV
jgi:hypothetical protein